MSKNAALAGGQHEQQNLYLVGAEAPEPSSPEAEIYPLHLPDHPEYGLAEPHEADEDTDENDALVDDWDEDVPASDSIRLYLNEIGRIPLLTAEQEVELAIRIEKGKDAAAKLSRSESDQVELAPIVKAILIKQSLDGRAARWHLIEANYRLCVSIAKRYQGKGVTLLDLIQAGNEKGLPRAADKFDYTKGYKFSTYATWWLRQTMQRAVADMGRTIRIPIHATETINKINKRQKELTEELGREPTIGEIAASTKLKPDKVAEHMAFDKQATVSWESKVGESKDTELGSFVPDETPEPAEVAIRSLMVSDVRQAVQDGELLTDIERKVIESRYLSDPILTQEELGKELGRSQHDISKMEGRALGKIRKSKKYGQRLREYL